MQPGTWLKYYVAEGGRLPMYFRFVGEVRGEVPVHYIFETSWGRYVAGEWLLNHLEPLREAEVPPVWKRWESKNKAGNAPPTGAPRVTPAAVPAPFASSGPVESPYYRTVKGGTRCSVYEPTGNDVSRKDVQSRERFRTARKAMLWVGLVLISPGLWMLQNLFGRTSAKSGDVECFTSRASH